MVSPILPAVLRYLRQRELMQNHVSASSSPRGMGVQAYGHRPQSRQERLRRVIRGGDGGGRIGPLDRGKTLDCG